MNLINRIIFILSITTFYSNLNAQSVEQFFIKITPNQNLVNCGNLKITKSKTTLDFYIKNDKVDILKPTEALQWLNDSVKKISTKNSKIVFFIHGFWGSIPYSLNRTSLEFKKSYFNSETSQVKAIIHILWDANDLYYKKCLTNLDKSTNTLASVFNNISSNFDYSLLCHSMGNRFLYETLVNHRVNFYFKELILMAPDLNFKKYEQEPELFSSLADETIVFYHTKDMTLKMSKGLNKVERLGRLNKSNVSDKIQFIDCTSLKDIESLSDSVMRHLYFITSNTVKKQVQNILDKKNEAN